MLAVHLNRIFLEHLIDCFLLLYTRKLHDVRVVGRLGTLLLDGRAVSKFLLPHLLLFL